MEFTTKNKLADQVLRRISGGDVSVDSQYDKREIILLLEQVLATMVKAEFFNTLRFGSSHIGPQFISSFNNQPVLRDTDRDEDYSDIPHGFMNLPADRGIRHVSKMKGQHTPFIPVRNGSNAMYAKSPAGRLEGQIGFYPEGNRIYYTKELLKDGCNKVMIKLIVPSPEALGDDDPYNIPSDMEYPVVKEVMQLMGVKVESDDVNDNSNK